MSTNSKIRAALRYSAVCGDFYDGERLMSDHEVLALLNAALTAQEQGAENGMRWAGDATASWIEGEFGNKVAVDGRHVLDHCLPEPSLHDELGDLYDYALPALIVSREQLGRWADEAYALSAQEHEAEAPNAMGEDAVGEYLRCQSCGVLFSQASLAGHVCAPPPAPDEVEAPTHWRGESAHAWLSGFEEGQARALRSQPAPAVTEEMLEAALAAYKNELLRYPTTHNSERDWMRAALTAAINGKEK
jgi:hypothetical protein